MSLRGVVVEDFVHAERSRKDRPAAAPAPVPSSHPPAVELLHTLQRGAGNSAVTGMLHRAPSARLQRLIVNVDKKTPWRNVDLIVFKSMDVAFQEPGDHAIAEHASADYSKLRPNENLYFVGHGSPGKIGDVDPKTIAARMSDSKVGVPDGYGGNIIATSCSAGRPKDKPDSSGTSQLALGLDERHAALNITGAKGPSLRHIISGTHVIDPAHTDAARAWQNTHTIDEGDGTGPKTLAQLKADFETWKTNYGGFSARQGTAKATALTLTFMDDFVTEATSKNWLLPQGTGAGQDTELVHPSAKSLGSKIKSAFSWLGV